LYPLCLALIWLLNPHFPANIIWLKAFNVLVSLGVLSLLAYHFRRNLNFSPWVSFALVACLGLNWRFIEVSTEMMSEPLFMLLSVGALILAHGVHHSNKPLPKAHVFWLILLSAGSFYARSLGLTLIVALGLWLYLRGQRRIALLYTLSCGLLILPWLIWSASKPDTTYAIGDFLVRSFQETYFQSFKMDLQYEYNLMALYGKGMQELLGNFSVQVFPLLEWFFRGKPTVFSECLVMGLSFAGWFCLGTHAYQGAKAGKISPSAFYIGLYLFILPGWSFFKVYPRLVVVLLPLLYAAMGQVLLAQPWAEQTKKRAVTALLALILSTNLIHLWPYLLKPVPNTLLINPYQNVWVDYQMTTAFLNAHTPNHARLYTDNNDESYFYGLHTHNILLDFFVYYPNALFNQACPKQEAACLQQPLRQQAETLYLALQQKQVQYIIYNRFAIVKNQYNNWTMGQKLFSPIKVLLQTHSHNFQPLMQTPDGWITVYRFHPAAI
jgi:hypothetical protein